MHLGISDRTEIDVCGDARRRGNHQVIGDVLHVVLHGGVDVVQSADGAIGGRTLPAADGRGELRRPAPGPLQLIQGRVEFAPLAASEKAPLDGILQTRVVFALAAAARSPCRSAGC